MDPFTQMLGYLGSVTSIITLMPQVLKTWKTKSVFDISFATLVIQTIQVVAWLVYGALLQNIPLILVNLVMFTNTILLVLMKIKYTQKIN